MSDTKQKLSIPGAIIIAGVVIAGAVYFSQVSPKEPSVPVNTQNAEPAPRPASLDIRPISSEDHIRGPENAKITILEYSDLECPYCKTFHQSMMQVMEEYPNDIKWVFRHAPIPNLHPNAPAIANAAECAAKEGKFWEFTDVVFALPSNESPIKLADLASYAQQAGVTSIPAFQSCQDTKEFAQKIQADFEDGLKAGPERFGTPFNMVITSDGKKMQIGGGIPYPQLKAIIDPLLR